eukprot:TRINITY_DN60990_c0_g2_i1.p1 TRINITY_DN60990_c0_g2~~TRINITY_DN60990_c0_g2_i1.p1  ORF type:complete len:432 (+),score=56.77 TRINITY_DN60990_c0_g2_i1:115-1410(+)
MPPKTKPADPFELMNRALGRTGQYAKRKVRNPDDPKDAEYLRRMYPDFDETMGSADVDYRTQCKTDAEFARKFHMPPLVESSRSHFEHTNSVDAVLWGPEKGTFISASHDGLLKVWDAADGKCLHSLSGHTGGIYHCAAAPSGQVLVSCGSGKENQVLLWQWPQKKVAKALTGHKRSVHNVAISSDSATAATADKDGMVILWDLARGVKLTDRYSHIGVANAVSFCKEDPNLLVSGGADGALVMLDVREYQQSAKDVWRLPSSVANAVVHRSAMGLDHAHDGYTIHAALFHDKTTLFSGGSDNKLRRWDLRKAVAVAAAVRPGSKAPASKLQGCDEYLGHSAPVRHLSVDPDGRWAITACEDASCRLWKLDAKPRPGDSFRPACRALVGHKGIVSSCDWKDDVSAKRSATVISGSWDQTIQMYSLPLHEFA